MTPTSAGGGKSATVDFRKSLLETFAIEEKANQLLISHVADVGWQARSPSGKGRSIGAIAAHIHHVRLMWLSAADKSAKQSAKVGTDKATQTGFGLWEWGSLWRECGFGK